MFSLKIPPPPIDTVELIFVQAFRVIVTQRHLFTFRVFIMYMSSVCTWHTDDFLLCSK